ncbi:MAG: hypothetical protein ACREUA_05160 [Burkholderiales bacterium]
MNGGFWYSATDLHSIIITHARVAHISEAWIKLDLHGEGLQSINLQIAARLKRRRVAYALLLLFPLGMHRAYLDDGRGAWLYRTASGVILVLYALGHGTAGLALFGLGLGFVLHDVHWIDNRIATLNKALRMQAYLRQGHAAPADFKGRFPDAEPAEQASNLRRMPSFSEQEALLRGLHKSRDP